MFDLDLKRWMVDRTPTVKVAPKCPLCGGPINYQGLNSVECFGFGCPNFKHNGPTTVKLYPDEITDWSTLQVGDILRRTIHGKVPGGTCKPELFTIVATFPGTPLAVKLNDGVSTPWWMEPASDTYQLVDLWERV